MIIQLSEKECNRMKILESVIRKEISQGEAAARMRVSYRHAGRLIKRYKTNGAAGLAHKNRGRPSNRKMPDNKREEIVRIIKGHYADFGPTLVAEMLSERHGINLNKEVARRIMMQAGLWIKQRKRSKHRFWRPPKERLGEMVQSDSSIHDWFEGRAPKYWLIKFIDDATNMILHAEFAASESYHCVSHATIHYFQQWGLPQLMYTDKGKVYRVNQNNENNEFITQYQYAFRLLNVGLQHAHSPQAKGRVERSFGTDQDRLVKMLRLEGISDIEAANKYLKEVYIPKHNKKFARPAAREGDMHTKLGNINLFDVFCIREQRKVRNDWTIQYNNRIIQITDNKPAIVKPRDIVTISERLDGSIYITIRGSRLESAEVSQRPARTQEPKPIWKPFKPARNHPWRQYERYAGMQKGHFHCAKKEDISIVP